MTKKVLVFIFLSIMFLSMIIIFVSLKFSERSREEDYQKSVKQIPEPLPVPAPAPPLLPLSEKSTEERRRLVQDHDEKKNDSLEQSERTFKNIGYGSGVYKWEDNKGTIHFSDDPPTVNFRERNQSMLKDESKEPLKGIKEQVSVEHTNPVFKAIELVKDHATLLDPVSGKLRSVEERMRDAKKDSPALKWRYDAKPLENHYQYRVTQHQSGDAPVVTGIRTWIVDISTEKVQPENQAAKNLYW